ncbi:hypothetical protein CDEN61S_00432 [Castellaniella denitrificans]
MLHLPIDRWRDWIPADCPGCGRRMGGQGLCPGCLARLRPDAARPRCRRCAHPLADGRCPDCGPQAPAYDRVVAAFDYAGLGRDLIRDYKIQRGVEVAGRPQGGRQGDVGQVAGVDVQLVDGPRLVRIAGPDQGIGPGAGQGRQGGAPAARAQDAKLDRRHDVRTRPVSCARRGAGSGRNPRPGPERPIAAPGAVRTGPGSSFRSGAAAASRCA